MNRRSHVGSSVSSPTGQRTSVDIPHAAAGSSIFGGEVWALPDGTEVYVEEHTIPLGGTLRLTWVSPVYMREFAATYRADGPGCLRLVEYEGVWVDEEARQRFRLRQDPWGRQGTPRTLVTVVPTGYATRVLPR